MSVNRLFNRGADAHPDRFCLVDRGVQRTYREVRARRDAIAAILQAMGARDQKCAVYSLNSAVAFECILAIYRAGGVFVPLNSKNHVTENVNTIRHCDVSVVFFERSLASEVEAIKAQCPGVASFVCMDGDVNSSPCLEMLIEANASAPEELGESRDRLVSIYSTGGTTGAPKGVMFTPLTWEIMAANLFAAIQVKQDVVYLVVAPLTHAAGTIGLLLMAAGATLVVHQAFDAEAILDAIERQRVTHLYLPPTAIYMLLNHPTLRSRDYSSLEAFMYTSAPMSVDKLKQCLDVFGPVMMQFWGQTEAPIFCTCLTPSHHSLDKPEILASCGRPMLLTEVAIMDEDGRLLPSGERGELVVRGNLVMAGYYKDPEATAAASRFGWHHTGDVGTRDEDGYIYVVDRLKDMIITGGFNVYPSEVEQVIWAHPSVLECAVVGVPDEKWGEAVKAVIELKPGASVSEAEIIALCKSRLGSVKTPKSVEFWSELPRTSVGKLSKGDIRRRFWEGRTRNI